MNLRNEHGLFGALETELRKAKEPLDCATLFDKESVRQHAETVNRVSDYLGHMWRKGLALRLPAPRLEGTRARWLYVWKNKGPVSKTVPDMSKAIEFHPTVDAMLSRPGLDITEEDGMVVITLPSITITIRRNG